MNSVPASGFHVQDPDLNHLLQSGLSVCNLSMGYWLLPCSFLALPVLESDRTPTVPYFITLSEQPELFCFCIGSIKEWLSWAASCSFCCRCMAISFFTASAEALQLQLLFLQIHKVSSYKALFLQSCRIWEAISCEGQACQFVLCKFRCHHRSPMFASLLVVPTIKALE